MCIVDNTVGDASEMVFCHLISEICEFKCCSLQFNPICILLAFWLCFGQLIIKNLQKINT